MSSIVIPAHNEERSIGLLLARLAPLAPEVEIVVVCNGCSDRTAEIAQTKAPWAKVLNIAQAAKSAAMNEADALELTFPRLYLDADAVISDAAIRALFESVGEGLPAAAATPVYDVSRSSPVVRSFYAFWRKMPVHQGSLSGTGAMTLSQAGRARFDCWPAALADDYFLDGQFTAAEKARIPGAVTQLSAARRYSDLISRRARIHQGNRDAVHRGLRQRHSGGGTGGTMQVLRQHPTLVVHLPAHLVVTFGARALAWWRRRRGLSDTWFRDSSRG